MELGRRGFFKLTLASAAAVRLADGGGQLGNVLEATATDERVPDGVEKYVTTACARCPGGCGARVRLIDARAVKLEGNQLHPVSGGGLCPVGQAALQALYSPDRVHSPLRRVGARGAGHWQAIGWDTAMGILAGELRALRAAGRPDALMLALGGADAAVSDLLRRFARAYGTPHVLGPLPADGSELALWLMQGVRRPAAYDLENARYILSFGVPLLEGWGSPVRQMRALARIRQGTPGRRGKLVQFEPRLSPTAARADEWVPTTPGTEAALALGIASVLVAEGRYDRAFVEERTFGFDDWSDGAGKHRGFRAVLLEDYPPAAVARITGVPEESIRRIALEFVAFGPGLAIGPARCAGLDLRGAMAVHALNALAGAIERRGGVVVSPEPPAPEWPEPVLDDVAQRGTRARPLGGAGPLAGAGTFSDLARAPAAERPRTLLVWDADPLFTGPDPEGMRRALEAIPFVACLAPFLDETAAHADLVLPTHVFPEAAVETQPVPGLPRLVVGIGQAAVKPAHDTRPAGDIVLDLAHRIGGATAAAFPWHDQGEVLVSRVTALQHTRGGAAFGAGPTDAPSSAGSGTGKSPATDPPKGGATAPADYRDELAAKGGWIGPDYTYADWARVLRTPSGKLEFFSQTLRAALAAAPDGTAVAAALGLRADDDALYLPHDASRPEPGDPASYPLRLHVFTTLALGDGACANEPFLQEIIAPHLHVSWDSWAELNPATATRLGIADGAPIWVESPVGRVRVHARWFAGVVPDTIAVVLGQGHERLGRYARGKGANVAALLPATPDPLGAGPVGLARVKIYPA